MRRILLAVILTTAIQIIKLRAEGADTLQITLRQADSLLVTRNLSLIAAHYDVDQAEAARVQAKLFNNPTLLTEWNLRNPQANKWLDVGNRGQKIVAIQEVFRIAGQRSTAVKLAQEQVRLEMYQYEELVRAARYELHVAFYRYHFINNAINHIRSQLGLLKNLIEVYTEQYRKGNISLQELTRLNTVYFNISGQVKDAQTELVTLQQTLKILLNESQPIQPTSATVISDTVQAFTLPQLIDKALINRPQLRMLETLNTQQRLRHSLAKKEAIPDLTAGVLYDQAGSYIPNYTAFTVGVQIPLFNRNQGEIRAAKIGIQQSSIMLKSKQEQVSAEVESAWSIYHLLRDQYNNSAPDFEVQLDQLSEGLIRNYTRNNISLLEFTDLFEAYNTNIIQYNQLKADLNKAYEDLTYAVGEEIE